MEFQGFLIGQRLIIREMHDQINIGLIGKGNWGKNYLATAERICDLKIINVTLSIKRSFNSSNLGSVVQQVFQKNKLSGFIIATSPLHQPRILTTILELKIPVIVEKPLCVREADLKKIKMLCSKNTIIFVNHFHLFLNSFQQLEKKIRSDDITKIYIQDGNDGPFRKEFSSLFDWGPHGVGVCLKLMNEFPYKIEHYKLLPKIGKDILHSNWKIKMSFSSNRTCFLIIGNKFKKKKRTIKVFIRGKMRPIIIRDNIVHDTTFLIQKAEEKTRHEALPMEILLQDFLSSIKKGISQGDKSLEIALESTKILLELEKII